MTSSQLDSLMKIFDQKSLIFHPDFQNVDPKKYYRYCEIKGVENTENFYRSSQDTKKELLMKQKWRPNDENGHPNPNYSKNKATLHAYLQNFQNQGIDFLESTIVGILNSDEKIIEKFDNLPGLRAFFEKSSDPERDLMEKFANIVRFAVKSEEVLPERIYRCVDDVMSGTFSQEQCACLLAWMFFDTTPNRSFFHILTSIHPISIEKIKFLLNYFEIVTESMPRGVISFTRIKSENFLENQLFENRNSDKKLSEVSIFDDMTIEETALCTQVDFANKYIGGGVLRLGGVQEEIRFLMCPEMIVSMLLFDKMEPDEAISIVGTQVYSSSTGYSGKLKFRPLQPKDALQNAYFDRFGRIQTETLAINAIKFFGKQEKNLTEQLKKHNLDREILKAGVGFSCQNLDFSAVPIVSGWWGCGAYSGNKPLKFLIQLIAASFTGRPFYICTFGEAGIGKKCEQMKRRLDMDEVTVGQLYDLLQKGPKMEIYKNEMHVFDSIEEILRKNGKK